MNSAFFTYFAQKFQWETIPPLELLEENVFAGEIDISGTWDQYGLRLPSGAMALFLYCRENHELEKEEDPDAWSYHNPDMNDNDLGEAISVAEDIVQLSGNGRLVLMENGKLKIESGELGLTTHHSSRQTEGKSVPAIHQI